MHKNGTILENKIKVTAIATQPQRKGIEREMRQ